MKYEPCIPGMPQKPPVNPVNPVFFLNTLFSIFFLVIHKVFYLNTFFCSIEVPQGSIIKRI